jgi:hypothetical protein
LFRGGAEIRVSIAVDLFEGAIVARKCCVRWDMRNTECQRRPFVVSILRKMSNFEEPVIGWLGVQCHQIPERRKRYL